MTARILIIEDDDVIRSEVLDWLEFEGYTALGAANGLEGVQVALKEVPDLVISDINMPEMNGHRVLIELRSQPATASIPFIFMTARTTRADMRYGMELGAEDYITKPFSNEELLSAVKVQLTKLETQRKRSEQQMNELRSALTQTLPHELRTPLVGIMGYAELMAMDSDTLSPDDIREMTQHIVRGGQRLYRLIENYLLYAQIEMRTSDPEKAASYHTGHVDNADSVVANAAQKLANKHERQTDLTLDLQACSSARINGTDLDKIVSELVDNAFKFSKPQTPVTVSTHLVADIYQIHITDQGRGMKPEDISRIGAYTQFERTVYEQQGSGLGLIIAKRLVELYGGSLEIDSRPQIGTTLAIGLLKDN